MSTRIFKTTFSNVTPGTLSLQISLSLNESVATLEFPGVMFQNKTDNNRLRVARVLPIEYRPSQQLWGHCFVSVDLASPIPSEPLDASALGWFLLDTDGSISIWSQYRPPTTEWPSTTTTRYHRVWGFCLTYTANVA